MLLVCNLLLTSKEILMRNILAHQITAQKMTSRKGFRTAYKPFQMNENKNRKLLITVFG